MALSLLLASCAPAVTEGGLSEAAKHYTAGVEHHQQRRFGEAIAEYGEAIGFIGNKPSFSSSPPPAPPGRMFWKIKHT